MSFDEFFLEKYQKEFDKVCKTIQQQAQVLENSLDRILLVAWLKKLRSLQRPDESQLRIEYARYLLVTIEADKSITRFPFNQLPPTEHTKSLSQCLADHLIQRNLLHNEVGALHPIISHKSDDGRAVVAVKRSQADGTLLCYLSVSRDKHK